MPSPHRGVQAPDVHFAPGPRLAPEGQSPALIPTSSRFLTGRRLRARRPGPVPFAQPRAERAHVPANRERARMRTLVPGGGNDVTSADVDL